MLMLHDGGSVAELITASGTLVTNRRVTQMSVDEDDLHSSGSEDEQPTVGESSTAAGSSQVADASKKKKKKKKSKAAKALSSIVDKVSGKDESGKNIPRELVDEVLDRVKQENPEESRDLDSEGVRKALAALKVMDVIEGKSGLGGKNRKDIGEHKVSAPTSIQDKGD